MDPHPTRTRCSTGTLDHKRLSGVHAVVESGRCSGRSNPLSGLERCTRGRITLRRMMQLDDFDTLEIRCCDLSKAHGQHRSEGEVCCHQQIAWTLLRRSHC